MNPHQPSKQDHRAAVHGVPHPEHARRASPPSDACTRETHTGWVAWLIGSQPHQLALQLALPVSGYVLAACAAATSGAPRYLAAAALLGAFVAHAVALRLRVALPASAALPAQRADLARREPARSQESLDSLRRELAGSRSALADLEKTKQAAEAALLAKSEFLATMSHEIRTPLNGMIPLLEMVLSSPLGAEQSDLVRTAHQSSREMLRIVNDVLYYSKLESGAVQLEISGMNVRELSESVVKLLDSPARAKAVALTLSIDPSVRPCVRGDSLRLRQVLTNLLSNAIKFTDHGSVGLHVTRRSESHNHVVLAFSVSDTGAGLAPEAANKLFQPFSQVDGTSSRSHGGTGLGLVICRRIVEAMGGQIGVTSEVGRGSTFWFAVPLLKAIGDIERHEGYAGRRAAVLSLDGGVTDYMLARLQALELDAVAVSTTSDVLARMRHRATNGPSRAYDVVFVDYAGFHRTLASLCKNLARDDMLNEVHVVVLADARELAPDVAGDARVSVLPKNASDQQLRLLLEQLLHGEHAARVRGSTGTPVIDIKVAHTEHDFGQRRVLLVDDIPVNRKVGEQVLRRMGFVVEQAEGGREALERLATNAYDVVLMDCQMPDVDGYTATRAQRERERSEGRPRTPIIAMTANAMPGDREKCLAAGMDDHLPKPLDRAALETMLQRWIAAAPAAAETPASAAPQGEAPPDTAAVAAPAAARTATAVAERMLGAADSGVRGIRQIVAAIEMAARNRDVANAARSARTLQAAAQRSGLQRIETLAQALETALDAGAVAEVAYRIAVLRQTCDDAVEYPTA